jgi:hypothetical protein
MRLTLTGHDARTTRWRTRHLAVAAFRLCGVILFAELSLGSMAGDQTVDPTLGNLSAFASAVVQTALGRPYPAL